MEWNSRCKAQSKIEPGVEFVIARMTFGRRIELMRCIRDLASKLEFFEAGLDQEHQMEASLLAAEIDKTYLEWGLEQILGLTIDGKACDTRSFIDIGPEELVREALLLIRHECGLTEPERKN